MVVQITKRLGLRKCAHKERGETTVSAPCGTGTFVPGLILGWLLCALITGWEKRGEPACARELRDFYRLGSDPAHWNARELRLLPGIGERRALSALRTRIRHLVSPSASAPLPWEAVSGIGPQTASGVREELARRGIEQLELSPGRPPEAESTDSGHQSRGVSSPGHFEPGPESVH